MNYKKMMEEILDEKTVGNNIEYYNGYATKGNWKSDVITISKITDFDQIEIWKNKHESKGYKVLIDLAKKGKVIRQVYLTK